MGRTGGDAGQGARQPPLRGLRRYWEEPELVGLVLLLILGTILTVAVTGNTPLGRLAARRRFGRPCCTPSTPAACGPWCGTVARGSW